MPDPMFYLEAAKSVAASAGVTATAKLFFDESVKAVATQSIQKLFQKKPKAQQALEKAKQLPASEEKKVAQLAKELEEAGEQDQELAQMLGQWLKSLEKVNNAAKEGRTIQADNYFEHTHVNTINFDQRKS